MNDMFEESVREYFVSRQSPPPKIKASLHRELVKRQKRKSTIFTWLILLFAVLMSAATAVLAIKMTGSFIIMIQCVINLFLLIIGGTALVIFCHHSRSKGDEKRVVI